MNLPGHMPTHLAQPNTTCLCTSSNHTPSHAYLPHFNLPHHTPTLFTPTCPTTCLPTSYQPAPPHIHPFAPTSPATRLFLPTQASHHTLMHLAKIQSSSTYCLGPYLPHYMTTNLVPTCYPHGYPTLPNLHCHMTICLTQSHSTARHLPRSNPSGQ